MISLPVCKKGALLITVVFLSACAMGVSESDLYQPNFGLRMVPHFEAAVDPDPTTLANGIYGSARFQNRCYRCSSEWPQSADWAP
jgi:hypothetical protein